MQPETDKSLLLYDRLGIKVRKPGGIAMIAISDAAHFLTFCQKQRIAIYGVDVFLLENGTRPLLRWTRSFCMLEANEDFTTKSIDRAIALIEEVQQQEQGPVYIELTCDEEDVARSLLYIERK